MNKKLNPNIPDDLELIKEILSDQDIDFKIVVLIENLSVKDHQIFSVDIEQAAYEVNFWQQIYFDYHWETE